MKIVRGMRTGAIVALLALSCVVAQAAPKPKASSSQQLHQQIAQLRRENEVLRAQKKTLERYYWAVSDINDADDRSNPRVKLDGMTPEQLRIECEKLQLWLLRSLRDRFLQDKETASAMARIEDRVKQKTPSAKK